MARGTFAVCPRTSPNEVVLLGTSGHLTSTVWDEAGDFNTLEEDRQVSFARSRRADPVADEPEIRR